MTKVKIRRPKFNNNNKLTVIFGSTIAIILLLILIKVIFFGKEEPRQLLEHIFHPQKSVPKKPEVKLPSDTEKLIKEKGLTKQGYLELVLGNRIVNDHKMKKRLQQAKLIFDFKKKSHIDLEFPVAMDYLDLDLDDNVATILGTSLDGKKSFAVMAAPMKVSTDQAINFLMDNKAAFPFLKDHKFLPEQTKTFPAPESTGLKPLTIIPGSTTKGQGIYMALAERKDGKGTYLFMMEAPYWYFQHNEDGLEKMLGTVKAKP